MAFKEDKHNHKLYINNYSSVPNSITIEYIPKLTSVEDIKSDYWIDILIKLCVALTKVVLGRIRTRYTSSNALWTQDGDTKGFRSFLWISTLPIFAEATTNSTTPTVPLRWKK